VIVAEGTAEPAEHEPISSVIVNVAVGQLTVELFKLELLVPST
jgi:hypothetical protein